MIDELNQKLFAELTIERAEMGRGGYPSDRALPRGLPDRANRYRKDRDRRVLRPGGGVFPLENNLKRLNEKKRELENEKAQLYSLEEKYIKNQIDQDMYSRWSVTYKEKIETLERAVERLGNTSSEAFNILDRRLELMSDIKYIYQKPIL